MTLHFLSEAINDAKETTMTKGIARGMAFA
jgi:hypothetical protein